tara:strand:- start:199 stop:585 length:387 start_codon:yes stop_codon:yes gene_type:complete
MSGENMKTTTLEKINNYEEGHCDRNDNGDLIIKKYLLEDTYSSFIPYYTSNSMEELNELIDERFTFNDEKNNLFYEDNIIDLPMYLSQSLRTKLDRLGSFYLYKWDSKSRTYVEDLNLGTRTYPKEIT